MIALRFCRGFALYVIQSVLSSRYLAEKIRPTSERPSERFPAHQGQAIERRETWSHILWEAGNLEGKRYGHLSPLCGLAAVLMKILHEVMSIIH